MPIKKTIAVLAGDGIGPEVMQQSLRVLEAIAKKYQHDFNYQEALIGGAAYDRYQEHCPEETLNICQQSDAILFGSVGGPLDQQHLPKWQGCETQSILKLRKYFNFNINIRPFKIYPEFANNCPLKPEIIGEGIDLLIFRELSGGIYFGRHEQLIQHQLRTGIDECTYDEQQIKSIAHAAFQAAQLRTKRLCSVDKANVLATSKLWREVVSEVAREYPQVQLTHMLVDNCAMQLILNPRQFDVIVTENMFGDIISDLAAALPGSLGLIPSASLNAEQKGLYEPSGGSAPDIAGQGIANPCAQILSAAMMLRYSFDMHPEADDLEQAIKATINQGIVTRDLATPKSAAVSTKTFVDEVLKKI